MFFKRKQNYKVNIPSHLIQSIRIYQALMEAGLTLSISREQEAVFVYLRRFYPVHYVIEDPDAKVLDIELSHQEPYVKIGKYRQPLLFPNAMFKVCRAAWPNQRNTDFLFVGLITPERKLLLRNWEKHIKSEYPSSSIVAIDSRRGRDFPEKSWDQEYYDTLTKAKFSLCPNGDFVWTYRFFESALCGAIPIVQDESPLYNGFKFYKMDSTTNFEWNNKIAEHNFKIAKELLGPPKSLKQLLGV